ncbi:hypothetical protein JCM10213v2_008563 [Rhodosporidiobolus nylandii]
MNDNPAGTPSALPSAAPPRPSTSPPTRPASLQIPVPLVPVSSVPFMIGWGTIATYLFPHSGYNLGSGVSYLSPPSSSSPPKWTLQLESWYRAFCPHVWPMLEADQAREDEVRAALVQYYEKRKVEGAEPEELFDLGDEVRLLADRRSDRYGKLHVWPVVSPHPPSATAVECRCRLYPTSTKDGLLRFQLPDVPTDESRALGIRLYGRDLHEPDSEFWMPRDADAEEAEKAGDAGANRKVKRG